MSMNGYPCMDISLQLSMLSMISMWKSIDFYGCPCMDLLWILDPGSNKASVGTFTLLILGMNIIRAQQIN